MNKKKTPLILKLRSTGGTVYIFPSASEDIGLNIQTSTSGVSLSHYALLNLPALSETQLLCGNTISTKETSFNGNNFYAMSLQNYMMNFETLLTNQSDYNFQEMSTVTEKAFWHWLNKIGAIDFNNGFEKISNYVLGNYYKEVLLPGRTDTVIKCFGSIDAGNVLSSTYGIFNETYINVPTSYGSGPVYVSFQGDDNYELDKLFVITNSNYLEGRDETTSKMSYTNFNDYPYYDMSSASGEKLYKIASLKDGMSIEKQILNILNIARQDYGNQSILLSSFDDINIDIDNNFNLNTEFLFNAILLYYSIFDLDDLSKTAYATNLFGIIFLDGALSQTDAEQQVTYYIPSMTKSKSNANNFGNSYSFRVNMKTLSVYDNTDAVIQDDTTMSSIDSVDFSDVIANLNSAIDTLNSNTTVIGKIQDQYSAILTYYDNQEVRISNIQNCLEAYLYGKATSLIDTSTLKVDDIKVGNNYANQISMYVRNSGSDGQVGEDPYLEKIRITEDDVYIPALSVDEEKVKESYIILDGTTEKDEEISLRTSTKVTANRIFNEEYLTLKVKGDKEENLYTINGQPVESIKNQLYIDPQSKIFTENDGREYSLSYLLQKDTGNVNYIGFIPYIIYQLRTWNENENINLKALEINVELLSTTCLNLKTITYDDLKNLVSSKTLQPGTRYCITDYVTLVSSYENDIAVTSIQKPFLVIVLALDAATLSSDAYAIASPNTQYFKYCDLSKWTLKYDINNDNKKYKWANTSGKGVIYYMKDEYGNVASYDFKNIKVNGNFTFTYNNGTTTNDATIMNGGNAYNNVILPWFPAGSSHYYLNIINLIQNSYCGLHNNTFGVNCHHISLLGDNQYNKFGNYVRDIKLGAGSINNTFENNSGYFKCTCGSNNQAIECLHVFEGVKYMNLKCTGDFTVSSTIKNINIMQGSYGTSATWKNIQIDKNGTDTYLTTIKAVNSKEILV